MRYPRFAGSACPPRDWERQDGREHLREQRRADGQRARTLLRPAVGRPGI